METEQEFRMPCKVVPFSSTFGWIDPKTIKKQEEDRALIEQMKLTKASWAKGNPYPIHWLTKVRVYLQYDVWFYLKQYVLKRYIRWFHKDKIIKGDAYYIIGIYKSLQEQK